MIFARNIFLFTLCASLLFACSSNNNSDKPKETLTSGNIDISADETYTPIIKEQLKVFDSSYPNATINASFKPENECIKDFIDEKVKFILITRDLTEDEKSILENKKVVSNSQAIAKDAVAVIVNNNADDSVFSIAALQGILTGQSEKGYKVVFDGQGSSTLRFMLDSIIPGEKLGSNVFAAKSNDSVVNYVANEPNSIGFVGVSHVCDFSDPEGLAFINTVKIASIYNDEKQEAYKPYQAYMATGDYLLTRNLYYIHRDNHSGLASGFAKFLREYRGQLIFKQARLFPTKVEMIIRTAEIND